MELYFLGTVAGRPSRERNVTSIAFTLYEERGTFWLFDCGEGTQHQILRSPLKLSKLEKIFITHLHGDHIYGLPGLLTTRSHEGASIPLTIYGPKGLREFVDNSLKTSHASLEYELIIHEIEAGIVFEDSLMKVEAAHVDHRIECFGYRIAEQERPGRLFVEKLKEKAIPPGPLYAQLKSGHNIQLPNGEVLEWADYVGQPIPGRVVVIMGDTRDCKASRSLAHQADVLVHEATFAGELKQLAQEYYHSTSAQAAQVAKESGAAVLIITHISSRYVGEAASSLLDEARAIHPQTFMAEDHWVYEIARKN